ncbi:hypothetical protein LX81_00296 [Palleronia aestuarii]|uniref:Uncharacterized protein n=1 Tax=Palleronia aestuarii TaxID=568105 RepID=A0A2W7NK54_9RHOB|nr:hypothetical protein [Palleronia aestuarii]PZX19833.1 hypothetical protein LX81_00296 [Palleronia aestuarii]
MATKDRSVLGTDLDEKLADNTNGAITPAVLRSFLRDFLDTARVPADISAALDARGVEMRVEADQIEYRTKVPDGETKKPWQNLTSTDVFRGPAGPSAFEVDRENGFTGTVEEWLASLRGADGLSSEEIQNVVNGFLAEREAADAERAARIAELERKVALLTGNTENLKPKQIRTFDSVLLPLGSGDLVIEAAQYFSGDNLEFFLSGQNATIDRLTGRLVLSDDTPMESVQTRIEARNVYGSAFGEFPVTVRDPNVAPPEGINTSRALGIDAPESYFDYDENMQRDPEKGNKLGRRRFPLVEIIRSNDDIYVDIRAAGRGTARQFEVLDVDGNTSSTRAVIDPAMPGRLKIDARTAFEGIVRYRAWNSMGEYTDRVPIRIAEEVTLRPMIVRAMADIYSEPDDVGNNLISVIDPVVEGAPYYSVSSRQLFTSKDRGKTLSPVDTDDAGQTTIRADDWYFLFSETRIENGVTEGSKVELLRGQNAIEKHFDAWTLEEDLEVDIHVNGVSVPCAVQWELRAPSSVTGQIRGKWSCASMDAPFRTIRKYQTDRFGNNKGVHYGPCVSRIMWKPQDHQWEYETYYTGADGARHKKVLSGTIAALPNTFQIAGEHTAFAYSNQGVFPSEVPTNRCFTDLDAFMAAFKGWSSPVKALIRRGERTNRIGKKSIQFDKMDNVLCEGYGSGDSHVLYDESTVSGGGGDSFLEIRACRYAFLKDLDFDSTWRNASETGYARVGIAASNNAYLYTDVKSHIAIYNCRGNGLRTLFTNPAPDNASDEGGPGQSGMPTACGHHHTSLHLECMSGIDPDRHNCLDYMIYCSAERGGWVDVLCSPDPRSIVGNSAKDFKHNQHAVCRHAEGWLFCIAGMEGRSMITWTTESVGVLQPALGRLGASGLFPMSITSVWNHVGESGWSMFAYGGGAGGWIKRWGWHYITSLAAFGDYATHRFFGPDQEGSVIENVLLSLSEGKRLREPAVDAYIGEEEGFRDRDGRSNRQSEPGRRSRAAQFITLIDKGDAFPNKSPDGTVSAGNSWIDEDTIAYYQPNLPTPRDDFEGQFIKDVLRPPHSEGYRLRKADTLDTSYRSPDDAIAFYYPEPDSPLIGRVTKSVARIWDAAGVFLPEGPQTPGAFSGKPPGLVAGGGGAGSGATEVSLRTSTQTARWSMSPLSGTDGERGAILMCCKIPSSGTRYFYNAGDNSGILITNGTTQLAVNYLVLDDDGVRRGRQALFNNIVRNGYVFVLVLHERGVRSDVYCSVEGGALQKVSVENNGGRLAVYGVPHHFMSSPSGSGVNFVLWHQGAVWTGVPQFPDVEAMFAAGQVLNPDGTPKHRTVFWEDMDVPVLNLDGDAKGMAAGGGSPGTAGSLTYHVGNPDFPVVDSTA